MKKNTISKIISIIFALMISTSFADTGFGVSNVGTLSSISSHLHLDKTAINIGTNLPGYSFSSNFTVKNDGGITSVLIGNLTQPSLWITSLNPSSFSLRYNETDTIFISGHFPSEPDSFSAVIFVNSNGGDDSVLVFGKIVVTGIKYENSFPVEYFLNQNYPNPFNPKTTIEFSIPDAEYVSLKIYNIFGEEVTTLVSKKLTAGKYKYDWDAINLASGVYLYRIRASDFVNVKKMILMK